jgi:ABC-type multidrug transport system permease subunit
MNVEAERMIDFFVWRRLLPGLIGLAIFAVVVMFYLLR